jgi:hypothetical protein
MGLRKDIEILHALRAGAIVHVSEVARGLDCGCVCARCGDALVARKGAYREHHFAHYRDSDCSGVAESLLHRLAKELLSNAKVLALPSSIYRAKSKPRFGVPVSIEREILAASRVCISSVAVEQSLGSIVPDLPLRSDEGDLILEIAVSHRVDRAKLRHIRRMNIPTLELSLTGLRTCCSLALNFYGVWSSKPRLSHRCSILPSARLTQTGLKLAVGIRDDAARPITAWSQQL